MSRKIKFRAWTGTQMMYQNNQYLASFIRRVVLQICLEHGSTQQHESYLPNGGNIDEYLQQYIGIKDSKGREIYEGDILRVDEESRGAIKYERGSFYFDDWCDGWTSIEDVYPESFAVVIGNVYENAELLEEVKHE